MGEFNGKALYKPKGRSGEYSRWAVNFFNGCTGGCEYCYNRRFPLLSGPQPVLKACFKDGYDAYCTAVREIVANKDAIIRDGGVFLSFVSDPCLPDTIGLTYSLLSMLQPAGQLSVGSDERIVPAMILTKRADWVLERNLFFDSFCSDFISEEGRRNIAFGFTLTGHDDLEPGCSSNADRIIAMKILHDKGFRTWASIEPVIDYFSSWQMIQACAPFCDHFKIGLRTDKKFETTIDRTVTFVNQVRQIVNDNHCTVYWKESFRSLWGGELPFGCNFVDENFNLFI